MQPTQPPVVGPVEPTPAELLRAAARYLEQHGWCQGAYYADTSQPTPATCAVGAIAMAVYGRTVEFVHNSDHPEIPQAEAVLRDYLDRHLTDLNDDPLDDQGRLRQADVYAWNDVAGQDAETVITTLRAAAEDWDAHRNGGDRR